jgi:hypothetical protein
MCRRVIVLLACALIAAPLPGCKGKRASFNPALSHDFFPLAPDSVWTYQIKSKSQRSTYVVTDKALGEKYVPSLNVTGEVVEEYYNLDRGGTRPIVYVNKDGYINRLSGLDYSKQDIATPAWGRSEEGAFMPARLIPDLTWSSKIYPFGHMPGAFDIDQRHHTYFESEDVIVPAGHFSGCIRIETKALYEGGSYSRIGRKLHLTYEDWYAPSVGLIKTVAFEGETNGAEMERVELLRFTAPAKTTSSKSSSIYRPSAQQQAQAR